MFLVRNKRWQSRRVKQLMCMICTVFSPSNVRSFGHEPGKSELRVQNFLYRSQQSKKSLLESALGQTAKHRSGAAMMLRSLLQSQYGSEILRMRARDEAKLNLRRLGLKDGRTPSPKLRTRWRVGEASQALERSLA